VNSLFFTGSLGKDVETKSINGKTLAEFSVGMRSGWGDHEKTVWLRCKIWGKRAENQKLLAKLTKGSRVCGSGEISIRDWTNSEGVKQFSLEVNVDDLEAYPKNQGAPVQQASQDDFDDSVPF